MKSQLLQLRILWFILFLSPLIFIYIIDITPPKGSYQRALVLFVPAGVAAAAVSVWPRLVIRKKRSGGSDSEPFARYQTSFILSMALAYAITIYGFVLGTQGAPLAVFLPFFVVGWLLMPFRFPKRSHLEQME